MKRLLFVFLILVACHRAETPQPAAAKSEPIGNAERGQQLVAQYGCNVCHAIPGIEGVQGTLAPSLAGVASRPTISFGKVPNTPANLTQFIQNPASLNPQSSMPPMGLPAPDAQDIAAFLMTLK
jgi:cytochrome c